MALREFTLSADYIDNDLVGFGRLLIGLLNSSCDLEQIDVSSLRFEMGGHIEIEEVDNLQVLIRNRIPLFDYLIYQKLKDANKLDQVNWIHNEAIPKWTEQQISYSLLVIYFMTITRNKAIPDINEELPAFLLKFMKTKMTLNDIKQCLSQNDLNLFKHSWVKDIDMNLLSLPLQNRFRKGISGMRLFSVFKDYIPNKTFDPSLNYPYERIRQIAITGPYWEMHNLFQDPELSATSMNANLNNMITLMFTDDMIDLMLLNKSLFKRPNFDTRVHDYLNWNDKFFDKFKTPLFTSDFALIDKPNINTSK